MLIGVHIFSSRFEGGSEAREHSVVQIISMTQYDAKVPCPPARVTELPVQLSDGSETKSVPRSPQLKKGTSIARSAKETPFFSSVQPNMDI